MTPAGDPPQEAPCQGTGMPGGSRGAAGDSLLQRRGAPKGPSPIGAVPPAGPAGPVAGRTWWG